MGAKRYLIDANGVSRKCASSSPRARSRPAKTATSAPRNIVVSIGFCASQIVISGRSAQGAGSPTSCTRIHWLLRRQGQ